MDICTIIINAVRIMEPHFEAWLSLVERCVRDAEAVGSSPVASMNHLHWKPLILLGFLFIYTSIALCFLIAFDCLLMVMRKP